jgi:hypothetical protein
MTHRKRMGETATRRRPSWIAAICVVLVASGCATTDVASRDRLAAEAMAFDAHEGIRHLRLKIEAAREASLGGYGEASAGGCGCQ